MTTAEAALTAKAVVTEAAVPTAVLLMREFRGVLPAATVLWAVPAMDGGILKAVPTKVRAALHKAAMEPRLLRAAPAVTVTEVVPTIAEAGVPVRLVRPLMTGAAARAAVTPVRLPPVAAARA